MWDLSLKEGLDLIVDEKRINVQIFFEQSAMIQMRSLAEGNLGKETTLGLGLAISRDPTVEIS